jgi:hypothetical protein
MTACDRNVTGRAVPVGRAVHGTPSDLGFRGGPEGIRTPDFLHARQVLCRAELRAPVRRRG